MTYLPKVKTVKQQIIDLSEKGFTGYAIGKRLKKPNSYVYEVLKLHRLEKALFYRHKEIRDKLTKNP